MQLLDSYRLIDRPLPVLFFFTRRKTEQFPYMQSEGSSYGSSARDGGLLDSMKTLTSPNWSLQFSVDPLSYPHLTPVLSLRHSHTSPPPENTVWLYSRPEGACCRDTETITICRSTITWPRSLTENPKSIDLTSCVSSVSFTNQLYCNPRHCTEKQQQFWCVHKLPPPPRHLFLSYCKLFVTSVRLYSSSGWHSLPQSRSHWIF